jgi:DNA-binding transcriptional ArsR family regulator
MQTNLDLTLVALADPTRRAILQRLSRGEARVTEVAQPFAMSLNGVSKHIRMLERADLIRRRRAGRDHFLSFNPRPLDEAADWIARQRAFWTERLDALDALLKAEVRATAVTSGKARGTRRAAKRKKPLG